MKEVFSWVRFVATLRKEAFTEALVAARLVSRL